jgi:hypothetical protein
MLHHYNLITMIITTTITVRSSCLSPRHPHHHINIIIIINAPSPPISSSPSSFPGLLASLHASRTTITDFDTDALANAELSKQLNPHLGEISIQKLDFNTAPSEPDWEGRFDVVLGTEVLFEGMSCVPDLFGEEDQTIEYWDVAEPLARTLAHVMKRPFGQVGCRTRRTTTTTTTTITASTITTTTTITSTTTLGISVRGGPFRGFEQIRRARPAPGFEVSAPLLAFLATFLHYPV